MLPFYYSFDYMPFGNLFAMPFCDPTGFLQYSLQNKETVEPSIKKQQFHTNYSVNSTTNQKKQALAVSSVSIQKQQFQTFNLRKSTKSKKIKKAITDSKNFKPKKSKTKQDEPNSRYSHKNFESNIINKIFSFLWSEDKSKGFVNTILNDKAKVSLFFDYIKIVRKYCKRYINKQYLLNLCDYREEHIAYKIVIKQTEKLKYFSMSQFSTTIRKLIFIYLKSVCSVSILTSKKMRNDVWRQHFQKMRNIRDYLFAGLSIQEYDQRMSFSYDQIYNQHKNSRFSNQN